MNIDRILQTLNRHQVEYLLIGGMNFLLRHQPVLTFDVDVWIDDTEGNRARCAAALAELGCEWGKNDADWGPVANKAAGWLASQGVVCLTSPHGAIDIFRSVHGLTSWRDSRRQAVLSKTQQGTTYFGLGDDDMLKCQLALDESVRKHDRVRYLENVLRSKKG